MATPDMNLNEEVTDETGKLAVSESTAEVPRMPTVSYEGRYIHSVRVELINCLFRCPNAVAVDFLSGNIYVADGYDGIFVFDNNGMELFDVLVDTRTIFHESLFACIVISRNRIFITQYKSRRVLIFSLDGNFITHFKFREIHRETLAICFAVSEMNGDIYVCDTLHHRVLIFSNESPKLQSYFGIVKHPCDVRITDEFIYVFSEEFSPNQYIVHSFTHDFIPSQTIPVLSIAKYLKSPPTFCVDGSGNFFIYDWEERALVIINCHGELVQTTPYDFQCPIGITLDVEGRILLLFCESSHITRLNYEYP